MNNSNLIKSSKNCLETITKKLEQYSFFHEQLLNSLQRFAENPSIQNRLILESLLAYFEKHIAPQIITKRVQEKIFVKEPEILTIHLNADWRAFEFDRIFSSIDFLNKFFVVSNRLERGDGRLREERSRERVYREGRLHYYMDKNEDLKVNRIQYASPGFISFKGIADAISEIRKFVENTISFEFVRKIVDNYDYLKYERNLHIHEKQDSLRKAIAKTKADIINEKTELLKAEAEYEVTKFNAEKQKLEAMTVVLQEWEKLNGKIDELSRKNLIRKEVLEQKLIQATSSFHSLGFETNKISLSSTEPDFTLFELPSETERR